MLQKKIIKHINKLQQKKYRKESGEFVVEGIKGVYEALNSDHDVAMLLVEGKKRDDADYTALISKAEAKNIPVEFVARGDIGDIKTTDTFPGVMAVVDIKNVTTDEVFDGNSVVVLDRINDPGNLGTIIRTADWFGIKHIILSEDSVDPYNPKVVRSTMGSLFHVNILQSSDVVRTLKQAEDYTTVSLDLDGKPLSSFETKARSVYVFGSESHGIRPELAELVGESYTIAGTGDAESLNVAVAAGILMSRI